MAESIVPVATGRFRAISTSDGFPVEEALPAMLYRWLTLSNDGFEEFLLSTPFEGLEFGARSYDEQPDAE